MNELDLYTAVGLFVASRVVFIAGFAVLAILALRAGTQALGQLRAPPFRRAAAPRHRAAGTL